MSTEDAKAYLSNREVPRLFECLMTGLMFHRPNDHIQYLIDSLEKVKQKGQAELTWNMFVEVRSAKTPLPPITPDNGKRPVSRGRTTPKEEPRPITPAAKPSPLPPIGSSGLPNVPVVFIMGGPGCGKASQADRLAEKHPGWVNIHLGDLIRGEVSNKAGEDKWSIVRELVVSGDMAPEDVTLDLIFACMKNNMEANGYIIEGFPREMEQSQAFEKLVGRIDAVFLLDCEEDTLTNKVLTRGQTSGRLDDSPSALAKKLAIYKDKTLPVLKHYDDSGKLYIVDGEQEEETVHDELSIIFETLLQNLENGRIPSPPAQAKPSSGRRSRSSRTPLPSAPAISPSIPLEPDVVINMPVLSYVPPPELKVKDEGRKSELPQAPIIFVTGGPGSGKGTQCQNITERYPDIVHLSMGDILRKNISERGSADEKWAMITKLLKEGDMAPVDVTEELLINCMKEHTEAKAFIVEGYPRDVLQYEDFNRNIGGHSFTILLDCDENYLRDRLILRGRSGTERIDDNIPAIEKKLAFFARNTLPLLKLMEDEGKLIVLDGDRDEQEIFFDIVKCLDFSLYGLELEEAKTDAAAADGDDKADDADDATDGSPPEAETAQEEAEEKPEIVEETMVSQDAPVPTGALIDNPSYSAELDAAAASAPQGTSTDAQGLADEDGSPSDAKQQQEEEEKKEEEEEKEEVADAAGVAEGQNAQAENPADQSSTQREADNDPTTAVAAVDEEAGDQTQNAETSKEEGAQQGDDAVVASDGDGAGATEGQQQQQHQDGESGTAPVEKEGGQEPQGEEVKAKVEVEVEVGDGQSANSAGESGSRQEVDAAGTGTGTGAGESESGPDVEAAVPEVTEDATPDGSSARAQEKELEGIDEDDQRRVAPLEDAADSATQEEQGQGQGQGQSREEGAAAGGERLQNDVNEASVTSVAGDVSAQEQAADATAAEAGGEGEKPPADAPQEGTQEEAAEKPGESSEGQGQVEEQGQGQAEETTGDAEQSAEGSGEASVPTEGGSEDAAKQEAES